MLYAEKASGQQRVRALTSSTIAFVFCFAVWTIFSIIGVKIKQELNLTDTKFGILIATPILTGSISRIFLGILADQYGGRLIFTLVMIFAACATWLLTLVSTYYMYVLVALGIGLAGGSFAVGVAYVSAWYPKNKQGTALGIFGIGNIGAALTNIVAPLLLVMGWDTVVQIYALILFSVALLYWFNTEDDPALTHRKISGHKPPSIKRELQPLAYLQVWRFSLYYFVVFGSFVALTLWLPRYYTGMYGVNIKTAGTLTAFFSLPAGVFRALGGWLSDKYGARKIMYCTFTVGVICTFILSYPATDYLVYGINKNIAFHLEIGLAPFVIITFILGFFMSLGSAAVYKHIPVYYPYHVGSVGGIVGTIGGLGGFILPIAFGIMNDMVQVWTSCFMLLFVGISIALTWMHFAILNLERKTIPAKYKSSYLPELNTKRVRH